MSITEKYVDFMLGYIGETMLVQLGEPLENGKIAIHKLGPVVNVRVWMEVLNKYSRSANILLRFDKYKVERLFFMPLNSSPESILKKVRKEIDKIVNKTIIDDGRADEVREMYAERRKQFAEAIKNIPIPNEKIQ